MDINKLVDKINEISASKGITEQEIVDGILGHLKKRYENDYSDDDKAIIEVVKKKIVETLYNSERQAVSVNHTTKYDELFDLDRVEHNLADQAFSELESDGQVFSRKYQIGLTDDGIRNYRSDLTN